MLAVRRSTHIKPEPDVGDEIVVDIVDTDEKGRNIGKTERGIVLFLDQEVAALEARVKITDIKDTSGQAEVIDRPMTIETKHLERKFCSPDVVS